MSPLFFESTRDFLQSAIRTVIPLLQKIPCEAKALRDDVHGSTNAWRQEPGTAIPPPGEKCGLGGDTPAVVSGDPVTVRGERLYLWRAVDQERAYDWVNNLPTLVNLTVRPLARE